MQFVQSKFLYVDTYFVSTATGIRKRQSQTQSLFATYRQTLKKKCMLSTQDEKRRVSEDR